MDSEVNKRQWSNAQRRFRIAGKLLLSLSVFAYFATFYPFNNWVNRFGLPFGADYVMFFVAGQQVTVADTSLYDDGANQRACYALFPTLRPGQVWPYRYPPTVAVAMAPLAQLPFTLSYAVFFCIQIGLLFLAVIAARHRFPFLRNPNWLWAIVGCPLLIENLQGGQAGVLALAICVCFIYLEGKQRYGLAGAVLALAAYKPNVLMFFIVGFLIVRPQLLKSFVATLAAGVIIGVAFAGLDEMVAYLRLAASLSTNQWTLETHFWKVHGLTPIVQAISPTYGRRICLLFGLVATVAVALAWRQDRMTPNLGMGLLMLVNMLFNPYLPIYDLILLIPAMLLLADAAMRGEILGVSGNAFQLLAFVTFLGPLYSQGISMAIGFQLYSVVLLLLSGTALYLWLRRPVTGLTTTPV